MSTVIAAQNKIEMKTNLIIRFTASIAFVALALIASNQTLSKTSIGVISIDTRGLQINNEMMSNLVRIELEKTGKYEVFDKYDINDVLKENSINPNQTYGKTKIIRVGKLMNADKMITGSVERFGDKIVFNMRLIDIDSETIEKSNVLEFINSQSEIQLMVMITLNDLLGIDNDPHLVDMLINFSSPILSTKTVLDLSGPRVGMVYTGGDMGDRLQDPKDIGGYDMFPVSSMFGYQYEKKYMSAGDFQALIEFVGAINGLESGAVIPSITFLNGFRFNKSGFEFGAGPVMRIVKMSEGYIDGEGNWVPMSAENAGPGFKVQEIIDTKNGQLTANLGLLVAVGKTFKSGYLNLPVNVYFIPRKEGNVVGLTFGFNTTRKPTF